MRIIVVFLALFSASIISVAQDIRKDSQKEDGSRFISTEHIVFGKRSLTQGSSNGFGMDRELSMSCLVTDKDTTYTLTINFERANKMMTMAEGKKILVKLDNDSVLVWNSIGNIGTLDNENIMPMLSANIYRIWVSYIIPKRDIEELKKHDIVKFRAEIEWDKGLADFEQKYYKKKWTFRDAIIEGYNLLQGRLKKPIMDKLLEDF